MANTTGKKHGGRVKGSENKLTKDARKVFIDTLEGLAPNVQKAFLDVLNGTEGKEPNPERFLDLFAKYAQYFVPKKTENDIRADIGFEGIDLKSLFKDGTKS